MRDQENIFWKQKSRDKWLQDGDRNTKYFHLTTLIRRRNNKIEGLFDDHVQWHTDSGMMKYIAVNFFTDLFSFSNTHDDIRFVIPWMFPTIDDLTLSDMYKSVSLLEVKNVIFSIRGLKAPSYDGFLAIFYQN